MSEHHLFDVISAFVTLLDDHPIGASVLLRAIRTIVNIGLDWREARRAPRRKSCRAQSGRPGKGQV